jgi:ribosomal protein L11 methyltransferase
LKLLEQLFEHRQFARALDVGTGSGILAFAMRKLGATKVTAIDCDAVALDNAFENAGLNHLDGNIRFSLAPLRSIRGRFDLIAANILSSVLIPMAPDLKRRLHPDGALVLAGILAREVNAVTAAYAPQLKLGRMVTERSWCALLLQR